MGKIIGGGFTVGATRGKAEVMTVFDPGTKGLRIHSGSTFSANPVRMAVGLASALERALFTLAKD